MFWVYLEPDWLFFFLKKKLENRNTNLNKQMINFLLNYYLCLTKLTKSFKDANKASLSMQLEAMFTLYMQIIL